MLLPACNLGSSASSKQPEFPLFDRGDMAGRAALPLATMIDAGTDLRRLDVSSDKHRSRETIKLRFGA